MKEIDDLIRIMKKYWKTGDNDYLEARHPLREKIDKIAGIKELGDFIDDIITFYCLSTNINNPRFTYEDVYRVIEAATSKDLRTKE